jgi:hypothetical protein
VPQIVSSQWTVPNTLGVELHPPFVLSVGGSPAIPQFGSFSGVPLTQPQTRPSAAADVAKAEDPSSRALVEAGPCARSVPERRSCPPIRRRIVEP